VIDGGDVEDGEEMRMMPLMVPMSTPDPNAEVQMIGINVYRNNRIETFLSYRPPCAYTLAAAVTSPLRGWRGRAF
jgi:hypothetical protein